MERLIQTVRVDRVEDISQQIDGKEKLILCGMGLNECLDRASRVVSGAFDFDGTLHPRNTWAVAGERLPAELGAKDAAIRSWYWEQLHSSAPRVSLEDPDWFHGHISPNNQAVVDGAWVANDIRWYMEAELTYDDFVNVANELGVRDGAPELLLIMDKRVIITFGIEDVVNHWLYDRRINKVAVAGTRLTFDTSGRLTGHHPNVVASPTKRLAAERFRDITGLRDEQILVLGDSVVDVHMMRPDGFNVLLIPPNDADKKLQDFRENNLAAMWNRLTAILVSDSLMPLVNLLMHARL